MPTRHRAESTEEQQAHTKSSSVEAGTHRRQRGQGPPAAVSINKASVCVGVCVCVLGGKGGSE